MKLFQLLESQSNLMKPYLHIVKWSSVLGAEVGEAHAVNADSIKFEMDFPSWNSTRNVKLSFFIFHYESTIVCIIKNSNDVTLYDNTEFINNAKLISVILTHLTHHITPSPLGRPTVQLNKIHIEVNQNNRPSQTYFVWPDEDGIQLQVGNNEPYSWPMTLEKLQEFIKHGSKKFRS